MKASVRIVMVCLAAGAALVALPVWAQPTGPCPNGGTLGDCPAWVDINGNGMWDSGDALISFDNGGTSPSDMDINTPWGSGSVLFDSYEPTLKEASARQEEYNMASWISMGYCAAVSDWNEDGDAVAFELYRGPCPGGEGLRAPQLLGVMDLEGNPETGYRGLTLEEVGLKTTLVAQQPYLQTDIICTDVGGDGECDHLSLPWAADTVRKIGMDDGDGQVWVPINQATRRMTFNFPVSGEVPQSVAFAARTAEGIPTLSEWGGLASLLGLAAAGWWLLRRRQVVA